MKEDRVEGVEEERRKNTALSGYYRSMWIIFMGIVVGLLALIIGAATKTPEALFAGVFITPVSLFSGGLLLNRADTTVRLGMLIAGGLAMFGIGGYAYMWAGSIISWN